MYFQLYNLSLHNKLFMYNERTDFQNCLNTGSFCSNYFNHLYIWPYIFVSSIFSLFLHMHTTQCMCHLFLTISFVFFYMWVFVFTVISCFKNWKHFANHWNREINTVPRKCHWKYYICFLFLNPHYFQFNPVITTHTAY